MKYIYISVLIFCFLSCKKKTTSYTDRGFGYFPFTAGHWVIYDIDSTEYDLSVKKTHWELKEFFESEFKDNSGRTTMRIERYMRSDSTQQWAIRDVWYANRSASAAERVEENQRYIKLIFPVKNGTTWDGNDYNGQGEMIYEYRNADEPATINNLIFDSTATVLQSEEENLVQTIYSAETYGKHAGMIKKEYKNLTKNINGTIKSGVEYVMLVKSYKVQ